jgi:hypothetical protein
VNEPSEVFSSVGDRSHIGLLRAAKALSQNRRASQKRREEQMMDSECNQATAVRGWIGDVSANRVGHVWQAEDHEALLRAMRAADELTLALLALARRGALETTLQIDERKARHGIGSTTEPVGADVHTHGG